MLDFGCSISSPVCEIAQFADCFIVGINNGFQLGHARKYTSSAGLQVRMSYVEGNVMKLVEQSGESSFDTVCAIEVTIMCHCERAYMGNS